MSKVCIARLIVKVKADLVKQIREKGMNNHGVNVTICQSDIIADSKLKTRKKGKEYCAMRVCVNKIPSNSLKIEEDKDY